MKGQGRASWFWPIVISVIVLCVVGTWIYNVATGVTQ